MGLDRKKKKVISKCALKALTWIRVHVEHLLTERVPSVPPSAMPGHASCTVEFKKSF